MQVYRALFLLNRSYHLIVCRLADLQELRIFSPTRLRELRGLTQEIQTETNFHLWHRFGKIRNARDRRLKKR